MGNTILCRNTPCTQPRPVYKTVLSQIFQIAWERPRVDSSSTKNNSIDHNETINQNPSNNVVDIPKLQAHVNSHIKALIDYLEGSHKKLVDTGSYIQKVVTGSFNPEIHMLGLLVIIELIKGSPKFTHNQDFLARLHHRATNEEFIKASGNDKNENNIAVKPEDLNNSSFVDYGSNLKDNVAYFDNSVIETLAFLLDEKRNPFRKSSYRYVLKTLKLYAEYHQGSMANDKTEHIITDALELIGSYQTLNNREDLEVQYDFMALLVALARSSNVAFKFKHKFINHSYTTLKTIYELQSNGAAVEIGSLGNKDLEQQIAKLSFEFIETISQSVYDLNEFSILITPLFVFLDNLEWQDNQLQADIFLSLLNSMSNSSFDQAEIIVIDKIVEYVNFNKANSTALLSPYKHNEDINVKIRVFSVLSTIFERTRKTFLSFLVIDKISKTFTTNLKTEYMTKTDSEKLREAIYECQKRFIEKINNSSKNITQLFNSIATQLTGHSSQENKDNQHIKEILDFFAFTINYISIYPSQAHIPRESIVSINKVRNTAEVLSKTYHPVEALFNMRYQSEESGTPIERSDGKRGDLLLCSPDTAYIILANNLSNLRSLLEQTRGDVASKTQEFKTLILFILHGLKINQSLLHRKDTVLLSIVTASYRKILTVSTKEHLSKQNTGLLLYSVLSFFKKLNEVWNINTLTPYINSLSQKLPADAIQILGSQKELSTTDVENLIKLLGSVEYAAPEEYLQEFESFIGITATHLKQTSQTLNPNCLKEDFEELQNIYSGPGHNFISVDEGDSIDHTKSVLITGTPKAVPFSAQSARRGRDKQGSLADIHSLKNGSIIRNHINNENPDNSESQASFMDKSFEEKLKNRKQNKVTTNNLTNILSNQI